MKHDDIKQARQTSRRLGVAVFLGLAIVMLAGFFSRVEVRIESGLSVILQLSGVALVFFIAFQILVRLNARIDARDLEQLAARGYELVGEADAGDLARLQVLPALRVNPHDPPLTGARKFRRGQAELIVASLAGRSDSRFTVIILPRHAGHYVVEWRGPGADSGALAMLGTVVDTLRDIPTNTGLELTAESAELRIYGEPPADLPIDELAGAAELAGCDAFGVDDGVLITVRGEALCGRETVLDRYDRLLEFLGALD